MQTETAIAYFTIKASRSMHPEYDKYYLQIIDVLSKYNNAEFNIENSSISMLAKTTELNTENQVENTILNFCNCISTEILEAKKYQDFKSENIVEKCEALNAIQKQLIKLGIFEKEAHSILFFERDFAEMGISRNVFSAVMTQHDRILYLSNDLEDIVLRRMLEPLDQQIFDELKKVSKIDEPKEKLSKLMKLQKASTSLANFSKLYIANGNTSKIVRAKEIDENSKDAKAQIDKQLLDYQKIPATPNMKK